MFCESVVAEDMCIQQSNGFLQQGCINDQCCTNDTF